MKRSAIIDDCMRVNRSRHRTSDNGLGRVRGNFRVINVPRRSLSPPATRATAPSPSLLRATSTTTNRFSVPSRQNACLCPTGSLPPALTSEPEPEPIRAQRSCSTVTYVAVRCAYRERKCTARWSPNRAGSNTCGDTLAKSAPV
jgi:hypothetical protein